MKLERTGYKFLLFYVYMIAFIVKVNLVTKYINKINLLFNQL